MADCASGGAMLSAAQIGSDVNSQSARKTRAARRRTHAKATIRAGKLELHGHVTDVSVGGAYIQLRDRGAPLEGQVSVKLTLPDGETLAIDATVVRSNAQGHAVRWSAMSARARSALRRYAFYADLEDAVVRIQRAIVPDIDGNALPVSDSAQVARRLARITEAPAQLFDGQCKPLGTGVISSGNGTLHIQSERSIPLSRTLYVAGLDGPMFVVFEVIPNTLDGDEVIAPVPQRIYVLERRAIARTKFETPPTCTFGDPAFGPVLEAEVLDLSEQGAAIRLVGHGGLPVGTTLPASTLRGGPIDRRLPPARVERVQGNVIGLRFSVGTATAERIAADESRSVRTSWWRKLTRGVDAARAKLTRPATVDDRSRVVRYNNARGDGIAALVDVSRAVTAGAPPEVAFVVAPAFLRRKEVFAPLAQTLLDNLDAEDLPGAVLRFDATHTGTESASRPELVAAGTPYRDWTFSNLTDDLAASVRYARTRLGAKRVVLITFSVSAIAARRVVSQLEKDGVSLWIAPFGCPDAQDMFTQYLAGLDHFPQLESGQRIEPFDIYGREVNPNVVYADALTNKYAYLGDASREVASIKAPIVWLLGRYDYMVTGARVRDMMSGDQAGPRDLYEVDTGHVAQRAHEAIEVFRLIVELAFQRLFDRDITARDPSVTSLVARDERERKRIASLDLDSETFWERHMFGAGMSYEVIEGSPSYRDLAELQADLADLGHAKRVMEIGCGTGIVAERLIDRLAKADGAYTYHAVDLLEHSLATTRAKLEPKKGRGELHFHKVDLEDTRLHVVHQLLAGELSGFDELLMRLDPDAVGIASAVRSQYDASLHRLLKRGEVNASTLPSALKPFAETLTALADLTRAVDANAPIPAKAVELFRLPAKAPELESGFDRIVCALTLSYLKDPVAALAYMRSRLAPNGKIVVSSLLPDFDPSRLYVELVSTVRADTSLSDAEREEKLEALRRFAGTAGQIVELEDVGRFVFLDGDKLRAMLEEAGFRDVRIYHGLGSPPAAVIAVASRA